MKSSAPSWWICSAGLGHTTVTEQRDWDSWTEKHGYFTSVITPQEGQRRNGSPLFDHCIDSFTANPGMHVICHPDTHTKNRVRVLFNPLLSYSKCALWSHWANPITDWSVLGFSPPPHTHTLHCRNMSSSITYDRVTARSHSKDVWSLSTWQWHAAPPLLWRKLLILTLFSFQPWIFSVNK